MKNMLLLSLLLLLVVVSINAITLPDKDMVFKKCTGLIGSSCPKGYERIYKGDGIYAQCYCKRPMNKEELEERRISRCRNSVFVCKERGAYCADVFDCPPDLLIELCPAIDKTYFTEDFCRKVKQDYADLKNREGKTDDDLRKCPGYKEFCLNGSKYSCSKAASTCDIRSLKQLCDANGNISEIDCIKIESDFKALEPKDEPKVEEKPRSPEDEELCNKYKASCEATSKNADCLDVASYCENKVVADFCRKGFIKNSATCSYAYNNS